MRRRTYRGGSAALVALAVALTGCTADAGESGGTTDGKSGSTGASETSVEPGRYRTLPEPCGSLGRESLRAALFPEDVGRGADDATLEGEAAVTFDTDRRVGCTWKSATSLGSHHLTLDFERVVSYDPEVSDGDRAVELFDQRATEADIPATAPPTDEPSDPAASDGGSEEPSDGASEEPSGAASEAPGDEASREPSGADEEGPDPASAPGGTPPAGPGPDGEPDAETPDPALAPRPLEGVGEAAYLDDELVTADAGVHRDITLVFRKGNVIVTVQYNQWSTDKRRLPDSEELQRQAGRLAQQIAERLDS
ncbi:hypothetical protein GCM10023347_10250 [Streptomyces chumphonensis]|uniref:DUF3558 domain-containing protein n=1 Tax=Streptomyces chumphonensis TaxID=1214925 RepID=A0A927F1Q4_9ACTN|nr:hypothetical protein [Streptomyces chumphonensis]MBD3933969.1 hypothetical protein [Streptomyces chumphonensis]